MFTCPATFARARVTTGKRWTCSYKGKNIYEVLEMTVEEALAFFDAHEPIRRKLQTLYDVGLGYIKLGQPSTPRCPAARPSASSWPPN